METSASQYVTWMEYLEWEINSFDKYCYYMAQIAAEVRRPYARKGTIVKIEDFIMKFLPKKASNETPAEVITKTHRFKQAFFSLTGLLGDKKKKGKKRP